MKAALVVPIYLRIIITGMPKSTLQLGKKMMFVAKYSPQGNKVIIIVPKQHHNDIKK
jgi:hypothetical protein